MYLNPDALPVPTKATRGRARGAVQGLVGAPIFACAVVVAIAPVSVSAADLTL